ncbi:MAG: helix-turn-helix domain-containing protein [Bacteroidales bacterium]|nr:helix-turn-helix domain-containing protein [Bacteroidales bacterium]
MPLFDQRPRLMGVREAANVLHCSPDTVRRLVRDGKLPHVIIGRRIIRVSEQAVTALANPAAKPEGGAA